MDTTTSPDGTRIAYWRSGQGDPLEASRLTANLRRLVLYEPPVTPDPGPPGIVDRLAALLAEGRGEDVIATFFREVVGMGEEELETLRSLPSWPARVAAAHTVPRELRADDGYTFDPGGFASVATPTLLLLGGDSPPFLHASTQQVAAALSDSRVTVLPGQAHIAMDTAPQLFADAVTAFLHEG